MNKNVICVIDGAAGSCGKGKVIGEILTDETINITASITNCMPNAGHTFVDAKTKRVFKNIPIGIINPHTELFIGPGSAIDMDDFIKEYESVKDLLGIRKIYVHEMVPLIKKHHKEYEATHIKSGSTHKGCGAVVQDKIIRNPNLEFFKGYKNAISCSNSEYHERLLKHLENRAGYVLLEGAQGCDLSLNHSGNYPYVTSRNVSSAQLLADSGISPERLLETIMVIRPFPIRINNFNQFGEFNYTGNYGTAQELTWSQINIASLMGNYPTSYDFLYLDYELDKTYLQFLLEETPLIFIKQIFQDETVNINKIKLLQALELERLFYKSINVKKYKSEIITLPDNMLIEDLSEQPTVTKMERRIFDLDINKLKLNCSINSPYGLYLNFFHHLDILYHHVSGNYNEIYFNRYLRNYLNWLEENTNTDILALGTGPKNFERILKRDLIKR